MENDTARRNDWSSNCGIDLVHVMFKINRVKVINIKNL